MLHIDEVDRTSQKAHGGEDSEWVYVGEAEADPASGDACQGGDGAHDGVGGGSDEGLHFSFALVLLSAPSYGCHDYVSEVGKRICKV